MRILVIVGAAALIGAAASIAGFAKTPDETEATLRAYAAGYKAAFICSATFNAGKTLAQISEDELSGIYPHVADIVPTLSADIDRETKRVSVSYQAGFPPRIAQWRDHLGCVQLPVGATADIADMLPSLDLPPVNARADNGAPWMKRATVNAPSTNKALESVVLDAFKKGPYGAAANTSAVLIATPDEILLERYKKGFMPTTSQRTWSVAKSIAASVIGVAVEKGMLDLGAQANIPEWTIAHDPRRGISLENLLHMASGLDSNKTGSRTDRLYMGGGLVTDTATENALEAAPGKRWKYANNDTLLAVRSLSGIYGDPAAFLSFPFTELLYKIGMTHTKLETDWQGNFIMSSQVWTTARDMARLGLLYLQDGVWNGERLLPEGWGAYVSTPAPSQPTIRSLEGAAYPGYGAQWWLYGEQFPTIPSDTYAARGNRGQFLVIIPSRNLLIIRRGYDPAGLEGFKLHSFIADVVMALEAL